MRKLAVACLALLGALSVVACSGDGDPNPVAVVLTQGSDGELTLSAPDTLESGAIEIRFQNQAQGPADVQLIGVTGSHTVDEVFEVIQGEGSEIPDWLKPGGGVGTTAPGQSANAAVEIDEGTYYLIGSVEGGEDEESPEPASKTITISGDGGGSLPGADTTIAAKDYAFEVGELKAGNNEIRFDNEGKELHHVQAFPITQGSTIDDVRTFLTSEGQTEGPPPLDFEGGAGTAVADTDKAIVTNLNLKAGKYAFLCFITDRNGGEEHYLKGMLQEVTVAA